MIRGTKKPLDTISSEESEHLQLDLSPNENENHHNTGDDFQIHSKQEQLTGKTVPSKTLPEETSSSTRTSFSIDQLYEAECATNKVNHWRESEFSAGLVEPTWNDELRRRVGNSANNTEDANGPNRICCEDAASETIDPTCGCLLVSGLVCSKVGAGRIGNMVILKESLIMTEEKQQELTSDEDQEDPNSECELGMNRSVSNTKRKFVTKRHFDLILGPYWPCLVFITFPLVIGVSFLTAIKAVFVPGQNVFFMIVWLALSVGLCFSLFSVGCRDPGLLPKYSEPPLHLDSDEKSSWRWNDQAQTFKPGNAVYCPDCAVIVEGFDHTCPWTGTAIGKKNMSAFQAFIGLVFICLVMDIMLLTSAAII